MSKLLSISGKLLASKVKKEQPKENLYQIRLFSRYKIEIFQCVETHSTFYHESELMIRINHPMESIRSLHEFYFTEIINEPVFTPNEPRPLDKTIVIHTITGHYKTYLPETKHLSE